MLTSASSHLALLWLVSSLSILTAQQDTFAQSIGASSSSSSSASLGGGQTTSTQSSVTTTDAGSQNTVSVTTSINNSQPLTIVTVTTGPTTTTVPVQQIVPSGDRATLGSAWTRFGNFGQTTLPFSHFPGFNR